MQAEDILQQIAAGDPFALRLLYEMHQARVYNTALSYLQNEEDAEEIVQDVFVEVHQSAGSFQYRSSVTTWIYRITVNRCLDKIRHRNSKKRFAIVSSLFSITGNLVHDPPDFHHPGISMEHKEKAAALFSAISKLPANQQTAFILKYIEDLSQKEIMEIMGITNNAVEALLQRAKANLRKLLPHPKENDNKNV